MRPSHAHRLQGVARPMAIEMEHSPTAALDQLQHVVEKPPGGSQESGGRLCGRPMAMFTQHPVFTTDYLTS